VEHLGCAGHGGAADAYGWSQGVLTVAATDHVGGMDHVAVQALRDYEAGEGGKQGVASMAAHVPGASVATVGRGLACGEQDEGSREQGGTAVAAARAVAGLHRVERARSTREAHGPVRGQDHEAVDQSDIEPGHVEVDGVFRREETAGEVG